MKYILSLGLAMAVLCNAYKIHAQGMAVNTSGNAANSSAMLDVSSTTQGVLVPRMTATQRGAITGVQGLLVYQTDAPAGFYYYDGGWISLSTSASSLNATKINSGTVPAANGGAGTVNGILKADGSGNVSAATAGTDYLNTSSNLNASKISSGTVPAANGGAGAVNGILKANGSGTVSQATAGTDYLTSSSTLDATKLSGVLPALNGAALTNLPSSGGGSFSIPAASVLNKNSNYTLGASDVLVWASSATTVTYTLPATSSSNAGHIYYLMNTTDPQDPNTGNYLGGLAVITTGSDKIHIQNGGLNSNGMSNTLTGLGGPINAATLVSDGAGNWLVLSFE